MHPSGQRSSLQPCVAAVRGSIRLAQSSSGMTVYMEPEPIVQLNNRDALLHSQIRHHERRVLVRLSKHVCAVLPGKPLTMADGSDFGRARCCEGGDGDREGVGHCVCTRQVCTVDWRCSPTFLDGGGCGIRRLAGVHSWRCASIAIGTRTGTSSQTAIGEIPAASDSHCLRMA